MQQQQSWCAGRGIEPLEIDEVTIRRGPALGPCLDARRAAKEFAPERLSVRSRYPPRWTIGILASARHGVGFSQSRTMEVQIFGVKKSADTRKALRFFAERRVKVHFVDLN